VSVLAIRLRRASNIDAVFTRPHLSPASPITFRSPMDELVVNGAIGRHHAFPVHDPRSGHPVRRGSAVEHKRPWNTGSSVGPDDDERREIQSSPISVRRGRSPHRGRALVFSAPGGGIGTPPGIFVSLLRSVRIEIAGFGGMGPVAEAMLSVSRMRSRCDVRDGAPAHARVTAGGGASHGPRGRGLGESKSGRHRGQKGVRADFVACAISNAP